MFILFLWSFCRSRSSWIYLFIYLFIIMSSKARLRWTSSSQLYVCRIFVWNFRAQNYITLVGANLHDLQVKELRDLRCNSLFVSVNFAGEWEIYWCTSCFARRLPSLFGESRIRERERERERERNSAIQRILQLVELDCASMVLGSKWVFSEGEEEDQWT